MANDQEKALIKNAATERMFLKVAPESMVETYFGMAKERTSLKDKEARQKKMALMTMYAAKYSEIAFDQLFEHYHQTTGQYFVLFTEDDA